MGANMEKLPFVQVFKHFQGFLLLLEDSRSFSSTGVIFKFPVFCSWVVVLERSTSTVCKVFDEMLRKETKKILRKMMRHLFLRATQKQGCCPHQFSLQRLMHDRNKKAMELIAKGWNALNEVDRVIDYTEPKDPRLHPLFRTAKENFELALEADNLNTHARYWLARLHLKYEAPGSCKAIGAALLVEAADMGDPDAQYELGRRLRIETKYVQSDQQAFYYLEKAVEQLHPGALYLLGSVYLTGDCVRQDIASALWCFHRASEKGHAGAAIAYGSLLLKGAHVPEAVTKFNSKKSPSTKMMKKSVGSSEEDRMELAKVQFEIAAKAGCDLGLRWLQRLEEEQKLRQLGT